MRELENMGSTLKVLKTSADLACGLGILGPRLEGWFFFGDGEGETCCRVMSRYVKGFSRILCTVDLPAHTHTIILAGVSPETR